jgi:hypothetical protein
LSTEDDEEFVDDESLALKRSEVFSNSYDYELTSPDKPSFLTLNTDIPMLVETSAYSAL